MGVVRHVSDQTPGRYFVKWRAGVARIRYELEVQLPDGSAQTLTDLDLTSTSSVSFGMDISERYLAELEYVSYLSPLQAYVNDFAREGETRLFGIRLAMAL